MTRTARHLTSFAACLAFLVGCATPEPEMRAPPHEDDGFALRAPPSDRVVVAWWNVRDFSTTPARSPDFGQIGDAVRATNADVIAIGELNHPSAIQALATELGDGWSTAQCPKVGRTAGSREHYGFVWNSRRLDKVAGVTNDPDPGDALDRDPAWATFRTKDRRLDFTVLAVHITWGNTVGPRQAEIRSMADVWTRTQSATAGDEDLILVGDFNRNVGGESFDRLCAIPGVACVNSATGPTTISGDSTYDQVFLCRTATTEYRDDWGCYEFDRLQYGGDLVRAEKDVSDHRPVWIALVVPAADDD